MKIQKVKPGYRIRVTEYEDVLEFTVDHISNASKIGNASYREYISTSGSSYEYEDGTKVEIIAVVEPPIGSVIRFMCGETPIYYTRILNKVLQSCWIDSHTGDIWTFEFVCSRNGFNFDLLDPSADL